MEFGLFLIRIVVGLTLAGHGAQKLFGMFGGYGIAGTGQFFESIGFRPGRVMAAIAGLGELGGGLAFALGLLTPFASAVIIATMAVAIWSVHIEKGFFNQGGGYEFPLMIAAIVLGIAFTGAGPLSLDAILGLPFAGGEWGFVALGLGLAGALPPLVARAAAVRHA
jgi:putative oxidoreductase